MGHASIESPANPTKQFRALAELMRFLAPRIASAKRGAWSKKSMDDIKTRAKAHRRS